MKNKWWLFKHEEDSPDGHGLEYVAEHDRFADAHKQWTDDGLMMFNAETKQFFNVIEVFTIAHMIETGELPETV